MQCRWILSLPPVGDLVVYQTAASYLKRKKSLPGRKILAVRGHFHRGDCVRILLSAAAPAAEQELAELEEAQEQPANKKAKKDNKAPGAGGGGGGYTSPVTATAGEEEVARALVNLSAEETEKVLGVKSSGYAEVLGYAVPPEVCHINNIILTVDVEDPSSSE